MIQQNVTEDAHSVIPLTCRAGFLLLSIMKYPRYSNCQVKSSVLVI